MPDDEWKTAARRRLRLWTEEPRLCECGMLKDERGDHTLACQKNSWITRIHDRVRDSRARQIRKMGTTADLDRVAPQSSSRYKDKHGVDKIRAVRIDLVATVPGRDGRGECWSGKTRWTCCHPLGERKNEKRAEQK